jgi:putative flippase GtrA
MKRFGRYVLSGVIANAVDIGLFLLLTHMGVFYVVASIIGGSCGFVSAFYLHKYVSFQIQGSSQSHFLRYCILTAINMVAQNIILFACVEWSGIPEGWAKLIANGSVVLWNFFLYKSFVYRSPKGEGNVPV